MHSLHRELANLSDVLASTAQPSTYLRYDEPLSSVSHLSRYRHLARTSSREGILKLLSPAREYWLLGGKAADAGAESRSPGEAGDGRGHRGAEYS